MDWADGERERLRALVEGAKWQEMGNPAAISPTETGDTTVP